MNHFMIMAIVPFGYSYKVVKAADKAGAAGSTILRARGAKKADKESFFDFKIEPEEEIILIMTNKDIINDVCDAINKEFKENCDRGASLYILPVQDRM